MTVDPAATIVRASKIISTQVDGETVLFSIDDGHYCGLDSIGTVIWDELQSPVRIDVLCDRIAEQYDGARDVITADVIELIETLTDLSLVNIVTRDG